MSPTRARVLHKLLRTRPVSLDVALVTQHGMRYVAARLSFVYLRSLLRTAVHAAELWFLMHAVPMEFAAPLFATRAVFGISSSLGWGLFEPVRRRVREHVRNGRPDRARLVIEAWATLSLGIGLATLGYGTWYASHKTGLGWGLDGLYGTYVVVNALALTLDLWSRAIHAGAFALGQVYRSRWSMIVPDVLELALIVALFRPLGPFALGTSLLVTALLRSLLTRHYSWRAYRSRELPWPRLLRMRSLASLSWVDLGHALRGLLAGLPNQLDRLLVIVLLSAPHGHHLLPLAAPYYALRPVLGIAHGWARTYYADLVRMDSLASTLFRARLERLLVRASALAGALASATLFAGAFLFFRVPGLEAVAWLVPLTFVRSAFSVLQIRAIAFARTDALVALSAAMGCAFATAVISKAHDRVLLAQVTAVLAAAALLAPWVQRLVRRAPPATTSRVPVGAWLAELVAQRGPVRLHAACVDSKQARPVLVLERLQAALGTRCVARVGSQWLVWWEAEAVRLEPSALARLLGGTCREHASLDAPSGRAALSDACKNGRVLPVALRDALASGSALPFAQASSDLRAAFARELPSGYVIDSREASPGLAALPDGELAQIRRALLAEAHGGAVPPRAKWQVAVYGPRGEPSVVFVWQERAAAAAAFRQSVERASWRDSIAVGP